MQAAYCVNFICKIYLQNKLLQLTPISHSSLRFLRAFLALKIFSYLSRHILFLYLIDKERLSRYNFSSETEKGPTCGVSGLPQLPTWM